MAVVGACLCVAGITLFTYWWYFHRAHKVNLDASYYIVDYSPLILSLSVAALLGGMILIAVVATFRSWGNP